MKPIVTIPHPALRNVSSVISDTELRGDEFKKLLTDLSEALATRNDGVGLSAPQIAVNKRVFVVSGRVFDKDWLENRTTTAPKPADEYFINPVITKFSKKLAVAEEGCLSIPRTYGMVKRPATVTLTYLDKTGEKKERKATGLLSRIFQHEVDHLDGILFTDKATNIKEVDDTHDNQEL
jgi:peptide deformylase